MGAAAPHIVNDVSYVRGFSHESDFSRQAQYLVTLDMTSVAPCSVSNSSYVTTMNHECYFVIQSSTGAVLCSTELSPLKVPPRLVRARLV